MVYQTKKCSRMLWDAWDARHAIFGAWLMNAMERFSTASKPRVTMR
jgi:hypothetical protein